MDPILEHHYRNLAEGKAHKNDDGSISTVYTAQVDLDGVPTLIPTVWDGKILKEEDAAKEAIKSGIKWPTAPTHTELRKYDEKLHEEMKPMSPEEARQFLKVLKAGKNDNF